MQKIALFFSGFFLLPILTFAAVYHASPSDYKSYLGQLMPGDSLILEEGTYLDRLRLVDIRGEANAPIVITGPSAGGEAIFVGNACCNTVSLTRCAYLTISYLTIDGKHISYVDAVKAEGNQGNWTHHITLHHLRIINHGPEQQTVGISTKCPSWDWHIHHNTIVGAGTGMYLGNSNGEEAFVNGLIEYNLIMNTTGYNLQIKRQNDNTRTTPGIPQQGKTLIRYNTFVKTENVPGNSARPNLLVGGFPPTTAGKDDWYEIYGNFFWQNQTEKLFQGTGNVAFHHNVLVNKYPGGGGIQIQKHHGRPPRNIRIFQNTLWVKGRSINFEAPDPQFTQIVAGNAVFTDRGLRNVPLEVDNIVRPYDAAGDYLLAPSEDIDLCILTPKEDKLYGDILDTELFNIFECYEFDFSGRRETWRRHGAYTNCCHPDWKIAIEIRPHVEKEGTTSTILPLRDPNRIKIYPNNIIRGQYFIIYNSENIVRYEIIDMQGNAIQSGDIKRRSPASLLLNPPGMLAGWYWVRVWFDNGTAVNRRILVSN